jgi:orotate phosphoribosyltransferase
MKLTIMRLQPSAIRIASTWENLAVAGSSTLTSGRESPIYAARFNERLLARSRHAARRRRRAQRCACVKSPAVAASGNI